MFWESPKLRKKSSICGRWINTFVHRCRRSVDKLVSRGNRETSWFVNHSLHIRNINDVTMLSNVLSAQDAVSVHIRRHCPRVCSYTTILLSYYDIYSVTYTTHCLYWAKQHGLFPYPFFHKWIREVNAIIYT